MDIFWCSVDQEGFHRGRRHLDRTIFLTKVKWLVNYDRERRAQLPNEWLYLCIPGETSSQINGYIWSRVAPQAVATSLCQTQGLTAPQDTVEDKVKWHIERSCWRWKSTYYGIFQWVTYREKFMCILESAINKIKIVRSLSANKACQEYFYSKINENIEIRPDIYNSWWNSKYSW